MSGKYALGSGKLSRVCSCFSSVSAVCVGDGAVGAGFIISHHIHTYPYGSHHCDDIHKLFGVLVDKVTLSFVQQQSPTVLSFFSGKSFQRRNGALTNATGS